MLEAPKGRLPKISPPIPADLKFENDAVVIGVADTELLRKKDWLLILTF